MGIATCPNNGRIAATPRKFEGEAACRRDSGNLAFLVERGAMNCPGRRAEHSTRGRHAEVRLNSQLSCALSKLLHVFSHQLCFWFFPFRVGSLPFRVGETRPPPVSARVIFPPQHPDLARALGEQVLTWKSHCDRKPFCSLPNQHDVP